MSSSYQAKWAFLKEMYIAPKVVIGGNIYCIRWRGGSGFLPMVLYYSIYHIYLQAFTDACDEPINRRSPIPTVLCASFCVSMLEPNVEAGRWT
jgi:hypothetical protein